jgi:hypothetical protein
MIFEISKNKGLSGLPSGAVGDTRKTLKIQASPHHP